MTQTFEATRYIYCYLLRLNPTTSELRFGVYNPDVTAITGTVQTERVGLPNGEFISPTRLKVTETFPFLRFVHVGQVQVTEVSEALFSTPDVSRGTPQNQTL